ncbi:MAG: S8 family serine peptidase [Promethearchaeota archaeon]|jgi:subtilisin family serine protease
MNKKKIYSLFLNKIENQKEISTKDKKKYKVIISFSDTSKRDSFLSRNKDIKSINKFDFIPAFTACLEKEQILKLNKEDSIKQVEEDQRLYLSMIEVSEIIELNKYKKSQISYTGKNVKLGIVDNGINSSFQAISNVSRIHANKLNKNSTDITHGTLMASIIANQFRSIEDNYIGIAPDVEITDFDISNSTNDYYFSNILGVLELITKENIKLDVLLVSLTTSEPSDGKDILSLACNLLADHGIIIVSPAGNNGPNSCTIGSPSAASKVISFGGVTKELLLNKFSAKGPTIDDRIKPDFCFPGSDVKIPLSDELTVKVTGTSVAAAIGTGLISLIKDHKADLTTDELFEILKKSCKDLNLDNFSQGYGMPNIVEIFKKMNLFHERILPYNVLVKKAVKMSVEFFILFLIIYFLFLIF